MRPFIAAALLALGLAAAAPAEAGAPQRHPVRARTRSAARRADTGLADARRPRSTGGDREGAPPRPAPAPVRRAPPRPAPPAHVDSVGFPNDGHLEGGAHLDTSKPYLRVVPAYATPDVRWGLPLFVDMIDRAARGVAKRYPGAVLDVGDISQRHGGDLLRHHSHESGRDADLGFYVLDEKGKRQLHAHGFIKFDASLRSETVPGARFDAARNWLLVQQMLLDPRAHVSHVFIAEPLKHQLLAYAKSVGVAQRLLDRASMTLMQPTSSLAHDDHMHVRISCPRAAGSTCIELAKNAPHGGRIARRSQAGWHARGVVLKTPPKAVASSAKAPPSLFKAGEVTEPPMRAPQAEDADADALEVKDEGGSLRITD